MNLTSPQGASFFRGAKIVKNGCTLAFALSLCLPVVGQRDCVLKKDKEGIQVYTCDAAQTKFKSIKATFTVKARLSQLAAFVLDVNNYCDWQYKTIRSNLLKKISEQEIVFYSEIAAPWPVSNRDMIVDMSLSQDSKTKVITVVTKGLPEWEPEKDHIVRVPMSQTRWTIVPISATLLKVEYFIQIDPGGSLPAWMVNLVSAQAPYDSFKSLKEKIDARKFRDSKFPFITDY